MTCLSSHIWRWQKWCCSHLGPQALTQAPAAACARAPPLGASTGNPQSFLVQPMQNATKYGNSTEDHVMHLLQVSAPCRPVQAPARPRSQACTGLLTGHIQQGLTR